MSKKTKRLDREETRRRMEAEAAGEARAKQERELKTAIGVSTVIFLAFWIIILLGVLSEGLWGPAA
jgi:hypothetical protein